jgi:hypothetical protein
MHHLPPEELRPRYENGALSTYHYLSEIGPDEAGDPHWFGASLVDRIAQCLGQEIATHTMSHFYCLEPGASLDSFAADLDAACRVAQARGLTPRSIVFPHNQYGSAHLDIGRSRGICRYRGNPQAWAYRPAPGGRANRAAASVAAGRCPYGAAGAASVSARGRQSSGQPFPAPGVWRWSPVTCPRLSAR